tara:strand:+ start:270154 stop:271827 length:1674 start_codon:yes stop_codon:yes gene_type:complete
MKVALVQESPVVGDLEGNVDRLLAALERAKVEGAQLAVCAELAISAYPPRDLLDQPHFIAKQLTALQRFAASAPLPTLVGFVDHVVEAGIHRLFNAAAFIEDGVISDVVHKTLLPTYDVFDERRYFSPATERRLIEIGEFKIGVSICEDIWNNSEHFGKDHGEPRRYVSDPIDELVALGANLLINLSASPFWADKRKVRQTMLQAQAKRHSLPLLVVNQVGAHDDLVFDGGSMAIDAAGDVQGSCKEFATDLLLVEVSEDHRTVTTEERRRHDFGEAGEIEACLDALVLGLRDYATKCGFRSVVLGLSGGIDSALTAAIAALALGPENVYGVALPSKYSSDHSLADAEALATAMGIHHQVISIEATVAALEASLAPSFKGRDEDVTEENLQARARGVVLMALSNKFGHLLLNTGNKSEVAVGYCTLYGDMCGGLSVLSDVFKTDVYKLALAVNARAGKAVIPESTIEKPPSAELRPGQLDQDSLPPYEILDALLARFIEGQESAEALANDFDPQVVEHVIRLVRRNEYKRYQLAPGLKVRSKSFGSGRRMPLACKHP